MRIGTWNLDGRWTDDHRDFLLAMDCDVLLLTEVNDRAELPGFTLHRGASEMATRRRWAAVASSSSLKPLPDPHTASAAAVIDGIVFCSSILPWRGCGRGPVWGDGSLADRTTRAVTQLLANLPDQPLVWGGDWNHALAGREYAGSMAGRREIQAAIEQRDLTVPTRDLPHRIVGLLSIDHIAVPTDWSPVACHVDARGATSPLSDHDAYVVSAGSTFPVDAWPGRDDGAQSVVVP
jgi:hypothetical protein